MEKQILNDIAGPIFNPVQLHPEIEIKECDINSLFANISKDMNYINSSILSCANNFKTLMDETVSKLKNIKKILDTEKEREEDLSILCNKQTDFSNIVILNKNNVGTDLSFNDNIIKLNSAKDKKIKPTIKSITGNGYDGNEYVYSNEGFISDSIDTSNKNNISDGSMYTSFEYSRICASNDEKYIFPLVNFDSVYARCSIELSAADKFNSIQIHTDNKDMILESICTSLDGQTYIEQDIHDIQICNREERFCADSYIYGNGIISFASCNYIKLNLRASSYTTDTIAFKSKDYEGNSKIKILKSAKRSVIRINEIDLFQSEYDENGSLTAEDFVKENLNSIAIFSNEYCSDELDIRNSVSYVFTINGIDYEVVPINSNTNGKKIIRTTNQTIPSEYVSYINETIKNASLTIKMNTSKRAQTPYLSDVKILIGRVE